MKKSHIVLITISAAFLCILSGIFISRNLLPHFSLKTYEPDHSMDVPASERKININTATAEDLMLLPGIGEITAQRIIDYREQNGPFQSVEQLTNVKGIGEGTMEKVRDYITTGG